MTTLSVDVEFLVDYVGEIFIDASFWVALVYVNDENHRAARECWQAISRNNRQLPVTTNWTLYEAMTRLSASFNRHDLAIGLSNLVHTTSLIADASELELQSVDVFSTHPDRRWSVVDCANFVCIRERDILLALSYDADFCQAQAEFAFVRLPTCG